jgi:hypothetical protein
MSTQPQQRKLIIVGFGPAGVAAAISAYANGYRNIQTIDPTPNPGAGGLNGVIIDSNSGGDDFVAEYRRNLPEALLLPEATELSGVQKPVKLELATKFLRSAAAYLIEQRIVNHIQEPATKITVLPNGYQVATTTDLFEAPMLLVAPGGKEVLLDELSGRNAWNTFLSKEILTNSRKGELDNSINSSSRVIIVGNSHSAYSVADELLKNYPGIKIEIYKRTPTKPYFENATEALEFGHVVSSHDDVCSDTGKINRFDGIRGAARELYLKELAPKDNPDINIESHINPQNSADLRKIPKGIPLIQATGLKPRKLPLFNADGTPLEYSTKCESGGYAKLYLEGSNTPLDNLFGLGICHSRFDGTNVYQKQAGLLLGNR